MKRTRPTFATSSRRLGSVLVIGDSSPAPPSSPGGSPAPRGPSGVPEWIETAAAWSWRLVVIAVAIVLVGYVLAQLRLVLIPLVIALFIAVLLGPPTAALKRRGVPPAAAAWSVFGAVALTLSLLGWAIVPFVSSEFSDLGPTISEGVDEIEQWLTDGPLGLDQEQIDDWRTRISDTISDSDAASVSNLATGARLVVEVLAGALLSIVVSFFFIKDGDVLVAFVLDQTPPRHRDRLRRVGRATWSTLAAYIRGAAILGLVEAAIIGGTLIVLGVSLALPVMVITFLAAFFPFVGAIVAGVIAVLAALVAGGLGDALIVAAVATVVQQLDNDILAGVIYGRAFQLHPLIIIVSLTTGGVLFGIAGAFLAVPTTAVAIRVVGVLRSEADGGEGPSPPLADAEPLQ